MIQKTGDALKMIKWIGVAPLVLLCGPAVAQPPGSVSFAHKDWELACDNTGTCRAAGYGVNEGEVSVLLTRRAGPLTDIVAEVVFGTLDDEDTASVAPDDARMILDDRLQETLSRGEYGVWNVTSEQADLLEAALVRSHTVQFEFGGKLRTLSGAGFHAVMLKMDDVQGRLNTAGAVVKKGPKNDNDVPPALDPPVIVKAATDPSLVRHPIPKDRLEALLPQLRATGGEECSRLDNDGPQVAGEQGDDFALISVDEGHVLIEKLCWRAACNQGTGYWLIDRDLKGPAKLITTSALDYNDGTIWLWQSGRGMDDCRHHTRWVWDGTDFRKSMDYNTGLCRSLTKGGTWRLYSWVATVVASPVGSDPK